MIASREPTGPAVELPRRPGFVCGAGHLWNPYFDGEPRLAGWSTEGMWSIVLGATGITGLFIAARRPRLGFCLNLAAQALWLAYAIATRQWGFLPMSAGYTIVYIRLLRRAVRQQRRVSAPVQGFESVAAS